jgi:vancomycin resistance protein YoaR
MTATTETLEATEPGRPSPWLRFGVAFVLGLAAVMLIGAAALFAYDRQFSGRIIPGVRVGSVDLSGLAPDAARAELEQAFGSLAQGQVVIDGVTDEHVITYAEIDRGPDVDRLIAEAMAVGRTGSAFDRALTDARTALRGLVIPPSATLDVDALASRVNAVADGLRIDPVNSSVVIDDEKQFVVVPGSVGRVADPEPLILSLTAELMQLDAPARINLDLGVRSVAAEVTAIEAVTAKQTADRVTRDILLVVGDEKLPLDGAVMRGWVSFGDTADGGYEAVIDTAPLAGMVEALAEDIDRKPVNAEFVTVSGLVTEIIPSKDGYTLDVPATVERVQQLLAERTQGADTIELVPAMTVTPPALTTAQAEAAAPLMVKISEWKTYFPISEKNGYGANIWIPALEIDGYVVGPRETFDFWDAIGPVTRERGYRDGGAIINGRTEPQGALAGGICSCSTTLFNAALRGGFEMGARRNHYYYIDRYPLGLDATVFISASGSVQTMSWTNDTDYPVLIRGYRIKQGNKGWVKFELYSVPSGPVVKNVRPASDSTQLTSTLRSGQRKRIEYPVDGKQVWRTVTVYNADGTVLRQKTYYSNYARITGIVLVGKGAASSAPTPDPTPEPQPDPTPEPTPAAP